MLESVYDDKFVHVEDSDAYIFRLPLKIQHSSNKHKDENHNSGFIEFYLPTSINYPSELPIILIRASLSPVQQLSVIKNLIQNIEDYDIYSIIAFIEGNLHSILKHVRLETVEICGIKLYENSTSEIFSGIQKSSQSIQKNKNHHNDSRFNFNEAINTQLIAEKALKLKVYIFALFFII